MTPTSRYSGRTRGGRSIAGPAQAIPRKNLAVFTRQLSVLLGAGLPLLQSLRLLGNQEPHQGFAAVILKVREDVESGMALASAMKKHPRAFDALYSNLIAAGEAGGILDTVLKRLALYTEKNLKLTRDVKAALVYPVAVMLVAVIVVAGILWKVIPAFASLFHDLGAQLPLPTRVVIAASDGIITHGWILLAVTTAAAVWVRRFCATPGGRRARDALLLKMPIVGTIVRKVAVARFCRTLSTLLASGIPILQGLEITARSAGNAVVERAIVATRAGIERGESIASPLSATDVFPAMVVQMISVGETTGALDAMLARVADFYEEEVDAAVAGLVSLLEPALIAVLGIVVGGIVISMYLPILDLINRVA